MNNENTLYQPLLSEHQLESQNFVPAFTVK